MIGRLTGRVTGEDEDGAIVVDVGGVGYEVFVPLGTVGRASPGAGGETTLYVHTHVREEALTLFGFATLDDRTAFRTLISVSNVGPKTAIAVLSALPAEELARAIAEKQATKLAGIPGIGKKTVERLLLELRDKLPVKGTRAPGAAAAAAPSSPQGAPLANAELVVSALTRMGYRPAEAERAVASLGARVADAKLPDLVREALALLAK